MKQLHPPRNYSGFTLVELLMVIMIIAVLAGLVIGTASYANKKAAISQVMADIERIKIALDNYKATYGAYPKVDGIANLIQAIHTKPIQRSEPVFIELKPSEITSGRIVDPWGNDLRYRGNPANNDATFYDLWSHGPDGKSGTQDDITNW